MEMEGDWCGRGNYWNQSPFGSPCSSRKMVGGRRGEACCALVGIGFMNCPLPLRSPPPVHNLLPPACHLPGPLCLTDGAWTPYRRAGATPLAVAQVLGTHTAPNGQDQTRELCSLGHSLILGKYK